jgi:RNA 2',3'-cyclic 3'-phosphodiesterase
VEHSFDPASSSGGPRTSSNGVKVRLFIALDLPAPVVEALVAWRAPLLREVDALRPVAPVALHATLCFLGWRAAEAVAPLAALVQESVAGGVAGLALGEPLWLPRARPRVLAVALEDRHGRLGALQSGLVQRLVAGGWHEPEARPYLPHVTVVRVRAKASVPRGTELPPLPALAFEGAAVVLYRSLLGRDGARYEPLFVRRLA